LNVLQPLIFAVAGAVLLGIHLILVIRGARIGSGQGDYAGRSDIVWIALPGLLALILLSYTALTL
jgi:hypothetical protein